MQHVATDYISHHTHGEYAATKHQEPVPATDTFHIYAHKARDWITVNYPPMFTPVL